jgi:hypothetical protein
MSTVDSASIDLPTLVRLATDSAEMVGHTRQVYQSCTDDRQRVLSGRCADGVNLPLVFIVGLRREEPRRSANAKSFGENLPGDDREMNTMYKNGKGLATRRTRSTIDRQTVALKAPCCSAKERG